MTSLLQDMDTIKYLSDNFDQCMIYCRECAIPTVDDGSEVINCRECGVNLVYREPVKEHCPHCLQYVPAIHLCRRGE